MRVLRVIGYVVLFLGVFFVVGFVLDLLITGVVFDVAGVESGLSITRSPGYLLPVYGVALVVAVLAVARLPRLFRSSAKRVAERDTPGSQESGERIEAPGPEPVVAPQSGVPTGAADTAFAASSEGGAETTSDVVMPPEAVATPSAPPSPPELAPSPRRSRCLSAPALILAALLLVGIGAVGAYAVLSLLGEASVEPEQIALVVSPTPSASFSDADLLHTYCSEIVSELLNISAGVRWEWGDGRSHRGTLFGPRVAVEYRSDGPKRWLASRKEVRRMARGFENESHNFAVIEAPAALSSEHAMLLEAVRIEARRWRYFDTSVLGETGHAQDAAFLEWEKWSKAAFKRQKRCLDDWASALRFEALKENVTLRPIEEAYLRRVEELAR